MDTVLMTREALNALTPETTPHIYSGKDGRCCCGCAGKHRYNSRFAGSEGTRRGYAVTPDEINDRQVARVLALVQSGGDDVVFGEGNASRVIGERLHVVYAPRADSKTTGGRT